MSSPPTSVTVSDEAAERVLGGLRPPPAHWTSRSRGPDITGTISNAKASPQVAVVPGYGQKEDSGLSTTIGTLSLTSDTARVEAARLHVC